MFCTRFLLFSAATLAAQSLPDLTITRIDRAGVATITQSLQLSGTLTVTVRNQGAATTSPFRVIAWEDRDGNGRLDATDLTLGSAITQSGLTAGGTTNVLIPVSGKTLFRGNGVYAIVDANGSIAESDESNNVRSTATPLSNNTSNAMCPSPAPTGLTLTPAAAARGFCLTLFADGFPTTSGIGPLGITFPATGGVLVSDMPGNVRRFPTNSDGQSAGTVLPSQFYGGNRAFDLARIGADIYMADRSGNRLVRLNDDGTLRDVVVSGVTGALGLAADPTNNLIFVSSFTEGSTIWKVDPVAKTAVAFKQLVADGITVSADGSVLYAAVSGGVRGFRTSDGVQVFTASLAGVDGLALGSGSLSGFIYGNTTDGRFVEIDLTTGVQTLLATGGSRGDFVAVDPGNGTLLLTQTSSIVRLTPPSGGTFGNANSPDYTSSFIRKDDATFPASVRLTARVGNGGIRGSSSLINLIQNGDAESQPGGNGANVVRPIPGWTPTGTFTATSWTTGNGYPITTDPGPSDRGNNFFSGGNGALSTASQTVVLPCSSTISSGRFPYQFSAWLGGYFDQEDNAVVRAEFLDGAGTLIEQVTLGPVTRSDRNSQTALLLRQRDGTIPPAARSLRVVIELTRLQGVADDGYIDNIVFMVPDQCVASTPSNLVTNGGFETGTPPCPSGTFDTRSSTGPTSTSITGWRVVEENIHYNDSGFWQAAEGRCSIDLDGETGSNGAIEQSLSTIPGQAYALTFQMAGNPERAPTVKTVRVSAAGQVADFNFSVEGKTFQNMGYERKTWSFVASSSTTTLRFESTTSPKGWGPVIDDVRVAPLSATGGPTSVSFYRGDPATGGTLIGTTRTSKALTPGEYEDVSITWNNPPPAGRYPIVVIADDPAAVLESDESNNKAGALILLGVGPFPRIDSLLTRFKDRAVDLAWQPIPGAAGYKLYRRTDTTPFQLIQSLTQTRYSDSGLQNGTTYYYLVRWTTAAGVESQDGTEASATPSPDSRPVNNTPPTILSNPVTRARAGVRYTYQVIAGDPDSREALTYTLTQKPSAMDIGATTGLIDWDAPRIEDSGYANVTVRVQDSTGKFATQTYRLFTEVEIINNPPVITSTPIPAGTSGDVYTYRVQARDPDNGDLLTYSLDAAPAGMAINQSTGLVTWIPERGQVAGHSVTVRVTDLEGASATQTYSLAIARGNRAPLFTSTAGVVARAGSTYQYQAAATDPDADPVGYALVSTAPAATISINAVTGELTWPVPASAPVGTTQDVTIRATDSGGLTATQSFRITLREANQPPVITSTPITTAPANLTYQYAVTATDPNLPNDTLAYALTAAPAGMRIDALTGVIAWFPPASLANTNQNVVVRVADLDGAAVTQSFVLRVTPPDTTLPSVSLLAPANGSTLTLDAPVTGTVTDDNLVGWSVQYRPVDSPDWITLATGATNVTNGQLAIFPATLLANDVYRLRLTARDALGEVTTPEIEIQVDTKELKMGDFTLNYEDIRVQGFTFPVSILRKYDTKRPQAGDFGPGWTLGFSDVLVRVDVNKNVFLTLPDGRRVNFRYEPACSGQTLVGCLFSVYATRYSAPRGVFDTLENLDCPMTFGRGAAARCGFTQAFNPVSWRLTTKEGIKYTIHAGRITRMEDRTGNWIEISSTGVKTNFGRDVTFRRVGNRISEIMEPGGASFRYNYDSQGRLIEAHNQNSEVTKFTYANTAFPHYITAITDALGREVLRNKFDAAGRLIAQCDANGNIDTLEGCNRLDSDPAGRKFTAINGRGFKTELFMDEDGNVLRERRFLDATRFLETGRTYQNNLLTVETDPEGNQKRYTYDARGNRLTEADPGGRVTRYDYGACDKVTKLTDPAGNSTTYSYDEKCNLRFVKDAIGAVTEYRYDSHGQRTHFIDPLGSTWVWAYDSRGLLTSLTDPFGKSTTFQFTGSGDLLRRVDRMNRRIDFTYDSSHRIRTETWGDGRVIRYDYDANGSLTSATDPDSALTMTYNNLGYRSAVTSVGAPGSPQVTLTYSFDASGHIASVEDTLGGSNTYLYDPLDRLARVTQSGLNVAEKRVDITYDDASLIRSLIRYPSLAGTGTAIHTSYEHECRGCARRVTRIHHARSDGSTIHNLTYRRNSTGNIMTMTDLEGAHNYRYDAIGRLLSAQHASPSIQPAEAYTYDLAGNRLSSHNSHHYALSYHSAGRGNRLMDDGRYSYDYDDEGSRAWAIDRVTQERTDFTYDYRNRLTSIVTRSASQLDLRRITLTYDALNRLVRIGGSDPTVTVIYDGLNPYVYVTSAGVPLIRRLYGRGLDSVLAEQRSGETRWFLLDHLGSIRDILSSSGSVLSHNRFDSFGSLLGVNPVSDGADLGFTGRETFHRGSLVYLRSRWMDPSNGVFLQEDQITPFAYSYSGGNPLRGPDPTGLLAIGEYSRVLSRSAKQADKISRVGQFSRLLLSVAAQRQTISLVGGEFKDAIREILEEAFDHRPSFREIIFNFFEAYDIGPQEAVLEKIWEFEVVLADLFLP